MATMSEKLKDLGTKVVRLRDKQNKDWAEISSELETGTGKVMLAYEFATVTPSEKFKSKSEDALGKEIVKARDKDGLSWGKIMARGDLSEGVARRLYEQTKGESTLGNRIGKGGRYPGSNDGSTKKSGGTKKAGGAKKTTAKKTPSKKATKTVKKVGAPSKVPINEMNEDQISARLNGKTVTVEGTGGKKSKHQIRQVKGLSSPGGELTFVDTKNNVQTLDVNDIVSATK